MKPIALQLYTVRDAAAEDFPGVLRRVAEMGYKGVEPAGLHGHDPIEIGMLVCDLGMTVCSSHTALPTEENVQQIVETERALGSRRVVTGFKAQQLETVDMCKAVAEQFNRAAELLKPHGMTLGYHNHWWEFEPLADGSRPYDILMAETQDVFSELDVYWCAFGGADPVETLRRYASKIRMLHIKDGTLEQGVPQRPVGQGALDFEAIIAAANESDLIDWLIVENDDSNIEMVESARQGYEYLTKNRLAAGNR